MSATAKPSNPDRSSEPQPVRHALVELLKRKLELGHLGNDAQLRLAAKNPQLWRDVRGAR